LAGRIPQNHASILPCGRVQSPVAAWLISAAAGSSQLALALAFLSSFSLLRFFSFFL